MASARAFNQTAALGLNWHSKSSVTSTFPRKEQLRLRTCEPANLRTCKPANLQICEPANLRTCKPANLQTCEPANPQSIRYQNDLAQRELG
jgi:hypothetical protein